MASTRERVSRSPVSDKFDNMGASGGESDIETVEVLVSDPPQVIGRDKLDLFFDDPERACYIDVIRLSPDTFADGVQCKGYCGRLTAGNNFETLRSTYGGGRFKLNKRNMDSGLIVGSTEVDVSGAPKKESTPAPGVSAPVSTSLPSAPGETVLLDVNGVKVPVPMGQAQGLQTIQSAMLFSKMLQDAFPPKTDINAELLSLLLKERHQPDPLDMFLKYKVALGSDAAPSGEANIYSLIQEGFRAIPSLVGAMKGVAPARGVNRATPPKALGRVVPEKLGSTATLERRAPLVDEEAPDGRDFNAGEIIDEKDNVNPLNEYQVGMAMVGEVCKAFRLDPPKEPARVVAMLDQMFRLDKTSRARLQAVKESGYDIAENQLVDLFEENPDLRQEFKRYYYELFDLFTDANREASFL